MSEAIAGRTGQLARSANKAPPHHLLAGIGAVLAGLTLVTPFDFEAGGDNAFIALTITAGLLTIVATRLAERAPPDRALWLIFGLGIALRVYVLLFDPLLSSDIYRYVWDGRVQGAGINPYRYFPAHEALAFLRDGTIFRAVFAAWLRQLYTWRCGAEVLAGHLERPRVSGFSCCAHFRQTASMLRQLRPALELVEVADEIGETWAASRRQPIVSAIIPCLDEEAAIGQVVTAVLAQDVSEVIVVDGASPDRTAERAEAAGARVIVEPRRGYGRAIQAGIAAVRDDAEILIFLDGDGSDPAEFISGLVSPIVAGQAVFVLGSRVRGLREPGSLTPQQIVAAYIGSLLLRLVYGASFTDLSPFRAIRRDELKRLGMKEETYGWNLEMLMRVVAARSPALEIAVGQRRRIGGVSKVSGNPIAGIKAVWSILATFVCLALELRHRTP